VTKGVDSIRSPVRNLQDFVPDVTHRKFVDAVAKEFMSRYSESNKVCSRIPCCSKGISHLKTVGPSKAHP
jgi:hypothetical protein